MSDVDSDVGIDDISSEDASPPTSARSLPGPDSFTIGPKPSATRAYRVGSFPNLSGDAIEAFFLKKSAFGPSVPSTPSLAPVVAKSADAGSEALIRDLLQQAQSLLVRLGNVQGAHHTFQLVLTFIRASSGPFSLEIILEVLKFLKPLTKGLVAQPLVAVGLLEQANGLAERFGLVEYQIKFSLQMPLMLLPEMDLQSDDTMKQLRRAVQECAGAHLLVTKYLTRLQSPSNAAQMQYPTVTSKIEKLSIKLNALLSTVEKMFLVYTATHVSFHPHILQTLDADTIFFHYTCLEKLSNHLLKRGDYDRARSLFPAKLQSHLIQHNIIYGPSLLKMHSEINLLECKSNGLTLAANTEQTTVARREVRSDSTVLLDILNELEQDQLEQANEYPKSPSIDSPKSQVLSKALKTDVTIDQAMFMQFRRSFAALRKQIPSTLLVSDDQGNLDTNLVNRVQLKLTKGVREIITSIIEQVLDLAGPPPCKFCIIGLGSHGRTEVAPYSDFEFALLLEKDMNDDDLSEDSFVNSYFGQFVEMMDFIVNCLGEPTGFRLDTQGTPKEYRFRGTPAQIVERAFKNLDAQGIPMAFSLLQPVCVYVGGPPKSPHANTSSDVTPSSSSGHIQLTTSMPSTMHRMNTALGMSHSGSVPNSTASAASPAPATNDPPLRHASSAAIQIRRPGSHSKAPPPSMDLQTPTSSSSYPAISSAQTGTKKGLATSPSPTPTSTSGTPSPPNPLASSDASSTAAQRLEIPPLQRYRVPLPFPPSLFHPWRLQGPSLKLKTRPCADLPR